MKSSKCSKSGSLNRTGLHGRKPFIQMTSIPDELIARKFRTLSVLVSLFFIIVTSYSVNAFGQSLSITDISKTSANSYEFSIVLENDSEDRSSFVYSLGQYFISFNKKIANSGTLQYSIVESGLPQFLLPRNPSVYDNILRLACNKLPADRSSLPQITSAENVLLIARLRLQTSAPEFSDEPLNLKWIKDGERFVTKVFSYSIGSNVDITNNINFISQNDNGVEEPGSLTGIPVKYDLSQNYPNPFNPSTVIRYSVPENSFVTLRVFDISGREVKSLVNETRQPGTYEVTFSATGLSSGIYFYRISAGSYNKVMKMALVK